MRQESISPRRRALRRAIRAWWVAAALVTAAPAGAQEAAAAAEPALPEVHILATGGTISGAGYGGTILESSGLRARVPEIASVATLSAEDPFTVGSSQLNFPMVSNLAQRARTILQERPGLAGLVITMGTDTLEECAFLFDLLFDEERPIVFTGAMRPPDHGEFDGPGNLADAIRLAASPATRDMGVLVTLHGEVYSAREVRKTHSYAPEAFQAPQAGALGYVDEGEIYLKHKPLRRVHLDSSELEPKVELFRVSLGSNGSAIKAAVEGGAQGIVVELFGRGNLPLTVAIEVVGARNKGIPVVVTTRTGDGRVLLMGGSADRGVVSAHDLTGLQARLVLVALLKKTKDPAEIQEIFDRLAGKV